MFGPVKNIADSSILFFPIVVALDKPVYIVPGHKASNPLLPQSKTMYSIAFGGWPFFVGPALRPWHVWRVIAKASWRGNVFLEQHENLQCISIDEIGTCCRKWSC